MLPLRAQRPRPPRFPSRTLRIACAALALSALVATLHSTVPPARAAQPSADPTRIVSPPSSTSSSTLRRFVRFFDFEEQDHPDPVPPGWLWAQEDPTPVLDPNKRTGPDGRPLTVPRAVRPGFPAYNKAVYDRAVAASGTSSVRLPTRGGSTALRLIAGEVPIFADADYGVSARVRTRGVNHARAFISARFLDDSLRPIEGSSFRSPGVSDRVRGETATTGTSSDADGVGGAVPEGWTQISAAIPGRFPGAAWLQIELELLQPSQYSSTSLLGAHAIREEDLDAEAWFDDVLIFLQPRASVRSLSPFNVTPGNEQPTLEISVRDLGGDSLTASISVFDLDGRRVAEHAVPVDPTGVPMRWQPSLPAFGWYRARLDVLARHVATPTAEVGPQAPPPTEPHIRTIVVASDERAFAWLAPSAEPKRARPSAQSADLRRIGVVLDPTSDEQLSVDTAATLALGARVATLPAWWSSTTREDAAAALAARMGSLDALLAGGVDLTLLVDRCPDQIAQAGLSDPLDLAACLAAPGGQWDLFLRPTLDRYGQRILRYQLGSSGREELFHRPGLNEALTSFESAVSRLVPGPRITLGWRADQARPDIERAEHADASSPEASTGNANARPDSDVDAARRRARSRPPTGPLVDAVTLLYPASFPSSVLMNAVEPWLTPLESAVASKRTEPDTPPWPELSMLIELPDDPRLSVRTGPRELVRRLVRAWELHNRIGPDGPPLRLTVRKPWHRIAERAGSAEPTPAWPALAFTADALAGRRIVGAFPGEPGTVAFILAERDERSGQFVRGALVGWNEHADPELARLSVDALGPELRVVDCFGNARELSEAERVDGLQLGDMPVFVEGIDPSLALFVAGFSVEPRFVRSSVSEHEHAIILTNPWPIRITGSMQIREAPEPDGKKRRSTWNITPAGVVDFAIGPRERQRIPFTFTFGPAQVVGPKRLEVLAKVSALREHPLLKLKFALDVGLEDLQLELESSRSPGNQGPDLVITASITNAAARNRTLRVEAATRDYPTQQLQVSDLGTGQTVIRRFVFKDAGGPKASGRVVIVSVSDLEEADRLNKMIEIP